MSENNIIRGIFGTPKEKVDKVLEDTGETLAEKAHRRGLEKEKEVEEIALRLKEFIVDYFENEAVENGDLSDLDEESDVVYNSPVPREFPKTKGDFITERSFSISLDELDIHGEDFAERVLDKKQSNILLHKLEMAIEDSIDNAFDILPFGENGEKSDIQGREFSKTFTVGGLELDLDQTGTELVFKYKVEVNLDRNLPDMFIQEE